MEADGQFYFNWCSCDETEDEDVERDGYIAISELSQIEQPSAFELALIISDNAGTEMVNVETDDHLVCMRYFHGLKLLKSMVDSGVTLNGPVVHRSRDSKKNTNHVRFVSHADEIEFYDFSPVVEESSPESDTEFSEEAVTYFDDIITEEDESLDLDDQFAQMLRRTSSVDKLPLPSVRSTTVEVEELSHNLLSQRRSSAATVPDEASDDDSSITSSVASSRRGSVASSDDIVSNYDSVNDALLAIQESMSPVAAPTRRLSQTAGVFTKSHVAAEVTGAFTRSHSAVEVTDADIDTFRSKRTTSSVIRGLDSTFDNLNFYSEDPSISDSRRHSVLNKASKGDSGADASAGSNGAINYLSRR